MYESFFGFHRKPFALLPDPTFLYLSARHRTALNLLEYGLLNQAGFSVVSGEVGCGKTTLLSYLLERMNSKCTVGAISQTHTGFGELLEWVLLAFNQLRKGSSKVELYTQFSEFVQSETIAGRRVVLIIDEAQNLRPDVLEELRLLSNINAGAALQLQLILVGQPELLQTLARPDLRQFAQRVAVDYSLGPLEADETKAYIAHRCRIAGATRAVFGRSAIQCVHAASGGVPRLVNLLCDTALVYAYAANSERVSHELVEEVVRDRNGSGSIAAATLAHVTAASGG